jgi:hypothetical protein
MIPSEGSLLAVVSTPSHQNRIKYPASRHWPSLGTLAESRLDERWNLVDTPPPQVRASCNRVRGMPHQPGLPRTIDMQGRMIVLAAVVLGLCDVAASQQASKPLLDNEHSGTVNIPGAGLSRYLKADGRWDSLGETEADEIEPAPVPEDLEDENSPKRNIARGEGVTPSQVAPVTWAVSLGTGIVCALFALWYSRRRSIG